MYRGIRRLFVDQFYYYAYRAVVARKLRGVRAKDDAMLRRVGREERVFLLRSEIDQLIGAVRAVNHIAGAIAEVGVFEGGTARLICEVKGDKELFLFDTFEGIPHVQEYERKLFREGQFKAATTAAQLQAALSRYPNVQVHKGIFPADTGHLVHDKRFSFVHLDVDVYQSTLESLEFFYPRMATGGIILSHDYLIGEGVRQAFAEFCGRTETPLIVGAGSQCLIVKLGS